jgi:hypothetical protein
MAVNIIERAIQPVVDLDTDVVVYVPGFAVKGPTEPTFVTRTNFTSLFGTLPYIFKESQQSDIGNDVLAGSPDRSWLYAKGILDAGLTVLFHRQYPENIDVAKPSTYTNSKFTGDPVTTGFVFGVGAKGDNLAPEDSGAKTILVRAKYKGRYYTGLVITITREDVGLMTVTVKESSREGAKELERKRISLKPSAENYISRVAFSTIEFYATNGFASLGLDAIYAPLSTTYVYMSGTAELAAPEVTETAGGFNAGPLSAAVDEVTISNLLTTLEGATSPLVILEDTEQYTSVSYITSGGYYQSENLAKLMQETAYKIKAIALVDLSDSISSGYETLKGSLETTGAIGTYKAKSTTFVGADTYVMSGYRLVVPDSYGYLTRLGANIASGTPYWLPVANNPNGVVSAVATTRQVTKAIREAMLNNIGASANPIIYKQNVGYTIMGNRTLYQNEGFLGPESFLNCQIVVNAIERAARRAAQDLLIVSTDPTTAFRTFKRKVSITCEKFLVNGDGLAAYTIKKLPKTAPATIDTIINLTLREGIEEWNITVPYSLEMD